MAIDPQPTTQPEAAPQIPAQPLPTRVDVTMATLQAPGMATTHVLRWDIQTPAGTTTFFADKAFATKIAEILGQHLATWPASLVVPTVDLEQVRRQLDQPNGKRI